MAGLERFDNRVWDRFFDFVAPDIVHMSSNDVDSELQRAGIDTTQSFGVVRQALEARKAREALARARAVRPSLVKKLAECMVVPIENARQMLHEMISTRAPEAQQPVLFRKLEKVATDEDLRSLVEDFQQLEYLDAGEGDVEP